MELVIVIAVIVIASLAALCLLAAFGAYRAAFYSVPERWNDCRQLPPGEQYRQNRERMLELIYEMEKIPWEQVWITAMDGTRLAGRYYHVRDGAPLQIQFHGYHGNALRDFCGGNKLAREAGQNTLVIDQRAHGKSGGHTVAFGVKERLDCLCWAKYAAERFGSDVPIILSGVSMGAATVLMAAALELPGNVKGIIADSPYSAPEAIIRKVCRDMKLPPDIMAPFVRLGARLFGGFDIRAASAVEAVREARIPILIIHGEDDRFVPCEMSREICDSCRERVSRETFPGAGHALSFIVDPERYAGIVNGFVARALNGGD